MGFLSNRKSTGSWDRRFRSFTYWGNSQLIGRWSCNHMRRIWWADMVKTNDIHQQWQLDWFMIRSTASKGVHSVTTLTICTATKRFVIQYGYGLFFVPIDHTLFIQVYTKSWTTKRLFTQALPTGGKMIYQMISVTPCWIKICTLDETHCWSSRCKSLEYSGRCISGYPLQLVGELMKSIQFSVHT